MNNETYLAGKLCVSRMRDYVRNIMAVHQGLGYNTTGAARDTRDYLKYTYSLMQSDLSYIEQTLDMLGEFDDDRECDVA